jgi:hypothetical protein
MDRLERYYRNKQDDHKQYDWDGCLISSGGFDLFDPEPVSFEVSYSQRRPNARYNLPRVIVSNLTQMSLGGTSFPEINCEGSDASEKALREWSKIMRLPMRIAEARNYGGQEGTACWSLGVAGGKFRCDVHNPKHCTVLEWRDRANFVPARVVKAYAFERNKYDPESKQFRLQTFWYVRVWDELSDTTWEEVPDDATKEPNWHDLIEPTRTYEHAWGLCPFYWVQNLPDSQEEDGEGDYEGCEDKCDEINALLSSTSRGARKNVDPTTVIHGVDDEEPVRKGSAAVIYSPEGAEYLEMKGTGVAASLELLAELRQSVLEETQCVIPREDKITGAAQSAAAMRILYRPMIARCNTLRDQYGPAITRMLEHILLVARQIRTRAKDVRDERGIVIERLQETLTPDLDPGEAEAVTLRWPEYFAPTAQDIKDAVSTAQSASGGKAVISTRTAVDYTARLFGVVDVDKEIDEIKNEADEEAARQAEAIENEANAYAAAKASAVVDDA